MVGATNADTSGAHGREVKLQPDQAVAVAHPGGTTVAQQEHPDREGTPPCALLPSLRYFAQ